MRYFPAALERLTEQFARLPGIGGKTAQRLAFHVLSLPKEDAENFAQVTEGSYTFYRYTFTDADYQYALENGEQGDYSATLESWGAGK